MVWTVPIFTVIKMDAEIGSYSEDVGPECATPRSNESTFERVMRTAGEVERASTD